MLTVETDKAQVEIEAPAAGVFARLLAAEVSWLRSVCRSATSASRRKGERFRASDSIRRKLKRARNSAAHDAASTSALNAPQASA